MTRDDNNGNDDNVRFLGGRTVEPVVAPSGIQIREGEGQRDLESAA